MLWCLHYSPVCAKIFVLQDNIAFKCGSNLFTMAFFDFGIGNISDFKCLHVENSAGTLFDRIVYA